MKELLLFLTYITFEASLHNSYILKWELQGIFPKRKDIRFGVENNFQMILIGFLTDLVIYLI